MKKSARGHPKTRKLTNFAIREKFCLNDTIWFDAGLPETKYSFQWDISDGVTSTEPKLSHIYTALGTYPIQLIITDLCLGTTDTINKDLVVSLRQAVAASGDTIICEGGGFQLNAADLPNADYLWSGPNAFISEEQFPMLTSATPSMNGAYSVIGIISGCATFPAIVDIGVIETPFPYLGEDTIFCSKANDFTGILDPGNYSEYLWQDGSRSPTFTFNSDGVFFVAVKDGYGCMGTDTVTLRQICPTKTFVPDAFTPNYDGVNDEFKVYGSDIISMRLLVFDRWGNQLFEGTTQDQVWDGHFNGERLDTGVYVWQLELEGYLPNGEIFNEVQSGSVTIIY